MLEGTQAGAQGEELINFPCSTYNFLFHADDASWSCTRGTLVALSYGRHKSKHCLDLNTRQAHVYEVLMYCPFVQGGLEVTPDMETDVISFKEGLYLATVGGAKALGIDVSAGSSNAYKVIAEPSRSKCISVRCMCVDDLMSKHLSQRACPYASRLPHCPVPTCKI